MTAAMLKMMIERYNMNLGPRVEQSHDFAYLHIVRREHTVAAGSGA